ncbi:CGNR zinc finger domain-containing protein [Paracoccus aurantiacus]|nr:ABATE domain-containing protein [Paracoccus aurantiacus]
MPSPHRIAGNIALDFANTISWRGTAREADQLATADALRHWLRVSGLRATDAATAPDPDPTLAAAHALRAAITRIGSAIANGASPPDDALNDLRDAAAAALSRAQLGGMPLRPQFDTAEQALGSIAWSALDLFSSDEVARIKECPFSDCHWLFVDRSKNGSRRWCDMATCGNRAKKQAMAAHDNSAAG